MLARLIIAFIVSCAAGAALWAVLQFGVGLDVGTAVGAASGLASVLIGAAVAWASGQPATQRSVDAARKPEIETRPALNTGSLKRAKKFFADRAEEWAEVQAAVRAATNGDPICEAFMIYGMPGVGKSEFAQHAARKLLDELSDYAGHAGLELIARQVELHGLEGLARTSPRDALRALLDLDGPDLRRAKMSLDDLAAEWRNHLQGKLVIFVLDNADSVSQISPFLPGNTSFILLVTGRRKLKGMAIDDLTPLALKELPEDGAVQMIKNIMGGTHEGEDQQDIVEVAHLFGCHPKAIALAVSDLAGNAHVTLADRLAELKRHPNLLLATDEYADEESGRVAWSFDLSYTHLSEDSQLVLRRLALGPVPAVSVEAAAALADLPGDVVVASLRELAQGTLIDDDGRESYQMHDLIRRYARSLAMRDDAAGNKAAVNRLLAYYWAAAANVDLVFTRQPAPRAIEFPVPTVQHHFADRPSVIEWARAELSNLLACADYVVRQSEDSDDQEENSWVVLFADALAGILRNDSHWRRSIELQTHAIISAERIHAPLAVANALSERGLLYRLTSELPPAVADLERAISIYREVGGAGGLTGQVNALNTYGVVLDQRDKRDEGRRLLDEALDICRQIDYRLGEANILHDQGMAEYFVENYDEAVQLLQQALELYLVVGQPLGMAHAYSNLARAQQLVDSERAAAENLESARVLYQELGNSLGVINVLVRLGAVLSQTNRDRAVAVLCDAITKSVDIGNRLARIDALDALGEIHMKAGETDAAVDMWSQALQVAQEHGMEREEARMSGKISDVR